MGKDNKTVMSIRSLIKKGRRPGTSYKAKNGGYECPHCLKIIGKNAENKLAAIHTHVHRSCTKKPKEEPRKKYKKLRVLSSEDEEEINCDFPMNTAPEYISPIQNDLLNDLSVKLENLQLLIKNKEEEIGTMRSEMKNIMKTCPENYECKYHRATTGGHYEFKSVPGIEDITFYPTMEEMAKGPKWYVTHVLKKIHKVHLRSSIVKIQPPPEWINAWKSATHEEVKRMIIKKPKYQRFERKQDRADYLDSAPMYQIFTADRPPMTLEEYKYETETLFPPVNEQCDAESMHWNPKRMESQNVVYATDVDQTRTLFHDLCFSWNLSKLKSNLEHAVTFNDNIPVKGMNEVYAYFGGRNTGFPIHIENGETYSINYLHWGEFKDWYGHDPLQYKEVIKALKKVYVEEFGLCKRFWRHKNMYPDPRFFADHGFRYCHIVQEPGQFVIAFTRGFHFGYNRGFNCAEAINFWTRDRIELGDTVKYCVSRCPYVNQDCYIPMKEMREEIDKCPRCSVDQELPENEVVGTCSAYFDDARDFKKERKAAKQKLIDQEKETKRLEQEEKTEKRRLERLERTETRNLRKQD